MVGESVSWLSRACCALIVAAGAVGLSLGRPSPGADPQETPRIGARGQVGCGKNPKSVTSLSIRSPGVYENYLVDGRWGARNLVDIRADNVTLRNCEIRNSTHNGVQVYARNVKIDSCRIHHMLAGTFKNQQDAHGITGRPNNLLITNCDISMVSGDAVQFDPDRQPWNDVIIENCTFWTGPLPADAAGFRKGERPGENAVDTKQLKSNPPSRMLIRNCLFYGWGDGQIQTQAALNIKNNVHVKIQGCILADNDVCFRLRGGTGEFGGALVEVRNCAVYTSKVAVRMEDRITDLKIINLGIGEGIGQKYAAAGGGAGPGYVNQGEHRAPPARTALLAGLGPASAEPDDQPKTEPKTTTTRPDLPINIPYLPPHLIPKAQ